MCYTARRIISSTMLAAEVVLFVALLANFQCSGAFISPEVTLEAYSPKGFRASIPAVDGVELFAFHGNINKEISQVDPGDYNQDFTSPSEDNRWSYYNPDITLKIGDEVNYWVFIQHHKLGYRKDSQKWKVTELVELGDKPCEATITLVSGKTIICKNNIVFEDSFTQQNLDGKKWTFDQFIPTYSSADYEFVSYQNKPNVCFVRDNKLFIKPEVANGDREIYGELDLRGSCTRSTDDECYHKGMTVFILPPVTSSRIISRFKFRYGKIEIKAKLPSGDWIFPQLYLQQVSDPTRRIWISYARGNDKLLANNEEDIGGSLLFGGPVLSTQEPDRSQYLSSKKNNQPFTSQMHTYGVLWTKDKITLQVDGKTYGEISKTLMNEIKFAEDDMVQIVLGVGVGGITDFPDDFRSGNNVKPWTNQDSKQVKTFFNHKNTWIKTWKLNTDNRALQIDSVKVWAI